MRQGRLDEAASFARIAETLLKADKVAGLGRIPVEIIDEDEGAGRPEELRT